MDSLISFFRKCNNPALLDNWWNETALRNLGKKIFETRLIPLNKKWPNIPYQHEFRPITVLSSAYKWIELRFLS